ncbi:Lipase chaperone LimK [Halopseudomonas xinjiangensis]|uniref:Lipase chaperone n=1 Tax=Halopseudomonas xinjiangensis TaxID=487184 RepID=A0A1H1YET2_9GAMM|nr:lipase secretion chaperone [Halopseudomonas xinjiangensis]SDT19891.1 Lipase chaperone LimK [Halopseudomonas xinjiangensis]
MKAIVYAPLLGCILLLGWHHTRPTAAPPERQAEIIEPVGPASSLRISARKDGAAEPLPPPSLRGTAVDGSIKVDQQGNLLVTEHLRDLFEYYLATVGEIEPDQAIALIDRQLQAQLDEPALSQARNLLDAYLGYRRRVAELEQELPVVADLAALRTREEAVRGLRARLFDRHVHEALFGREEAYNQYHLDRLAIVHDASLDPAERAAAIAELRDSQPEDLQHALTTQVHRELGQRTQALRAQNAPSQAVRQLRLELAGPEATERLERLDAERAQWQQRLDRFVEERQAILDEPGLADVDKRAAVEDLLSDRFDERERLRVAALVE